MTCLRWLSVALLVACRSPASAPQAPAASSSSAPSASAATLPPPAPSAAPRPPFDLASCTGDDLDLDRALSDPACNLPRDDARWQSIAHDSANGTRGGKLTYAMPTRELHAKQDGLFEATITVTNTAATPAEIAMVVGHDWGFLAEATALPPLDPLEGGMLVRGPKAPGTPIAMNDARLAYVMIPPHGVAHATYTGKATTTRTEHLEAPPGVPAPWAITPYPLRPGTYRLRVRPPWGGEAFETKGGGEGHDVKLKVEP
jgi:hypothetical protein